jgi:hypothetical protein
MTSMFVLQINSGGRVAVPKIKLDATQRGRKATIDKAAWLELAEDWMVMATKAQGTLAAQGRRKRQD